MWLFLPCFVMGPPRTPLKQNNNTPHQDSNSGLPSKGWPEGYLVAPAETWCEWCYSSPRSTWSMPHGKVWNRPEMPQGLPPLSSLPSWYVFGGYLVFCAFSSTWWSEQCRRSWLPCCQRRWLPRHWTGLRFSMCSWRSYGSRMRCCGPFHAAGK